MITSTAAGILPAANSASSAIAPAIAAFSTGPSLLKTAHQFKQLARLKASNPTVCLPYRRVPLARPVMSDHVYL